MHGTLLRIWLSTACARQEERPKSSWKQASSRTFPISRSALISAAACPAITRCRGGRRQIFVMQATRHLSGAHTEGFANWMVGNWCRGRHDEAGQVGKLPKDDSSQHDHVMIMPQLADDPATASVLARSNVCGAQA